MFSNPFNGSVIRWTDMMKLAGAISAIFNFNMPKKVNSSMILSFLLLLL
jgi:hypothetical protein